MNSEGCIGPFPVMFLCRQLVSPVVKFEEEEEVAPIGPLWLYFASPSFVNLKLNKQLSFICHVSFYVTLAGL